MYEVTLSLTVRLDSIQGFEERVEALERHPETLPHEFFAAEKEVVYEEYQNVIDEVLEEISRRFGVRKDDVSVSILSESFWNGTCTIEFVFNTEGDRLRKLLDITEAPGKECSEEIELCGRKLYLYAYTDKKDKG